ncbi:2-dehydropantoate 2-reductase [bacterium]|nr:MAG: 2-dehydropantoate 2-reductase [bacterium]
MRIAIIGPGALGSLFAALLARSGHFVRLVDRDSARAEKINAGGLRLWEGEALSVVPVRAIAPPFREEPFDLVLVTVKSADTREAAKTAGALMGPDSAVLTLQNGLGGAEILCEELGAKRVLVGVTAQGATLLGPGEVRHGGAGETIIGPASPKGNIGLRFSDIFASSKIPVRFTSDIQPHVWKKLAANCGINALTAILGVRNGLIPEITEAAELSALAVRETVRVAQSLEIDLGEEEEVVSWVLGVAKATGENRSSMLQDLERGNPTEIDFINGAVARLGQKAGVPCPVNMTLTRLVTALVKAGRIQPCRK